MGLLRAVRRVKEGTSAVLFQSGLDEKWWADSMECGTYLRNIQDLLSDGKTSYVKNPSIWKESLTWIVPWIRSVRGEEFGRVT